MDQSSGDGDHRHTVDDREGRISIIAIPPDQIAADQRGAGSLPRGRQIGFRRGHTFKADLLPCDAGSEAGEKGKRLGGCDHQRRIEGALGDLGMMHQRSSLASSSSVVSASS
ncbi:hypothetical protein MU516_15595 [Paracoccus sp. YLB-12]|uniref:Uncharacterized protein n=1 Tax=Paracoccus maritimus TaxID=2933292 RepID=A0ABT2KEB6_9RHOB|nr:hypothetical protein [Paracoccus sp. YLB-12]MCT4334289.1 hypothetical protein [Paracoccus sp. YLB-12]